MKHASFSDDVHLGRQEGLGDSRNLTFCLLLKRYLANYRISVLIVLLLWLMSQTYLLRMSTHSKYENIKDWLRGAVKWVGPPWPLSRPGVGVAWVIPISSGSWRSGTLRQVSCQAIELEALTEIGLPLLDNDLLLNIPTQRLAYFPRTTINLHILLK